ncbi:MAG: hypothetical protein JWL84_6100 [Rhodospirillales bacterium]|jgi:hypothetical protein|nr:hypothetical protein [Rhodospirillales bacterium]
MRVSPSSRRPTPPNAGRRYGAAPIEVQPCEDRDSAGASAFALLRQARYVIEVGPVRGPSAAVVDAAELRRMMAELTGEIRA